MCHVTFESFYCNKKNLEILDKNDYKFTDTFLPLKKGFTNFKKINLKLEEIYKEKENNILYMDGLSR